MVNQLPHISPEAQTSIDFIMASMDEQVAQHEADEARIEQLAEEYYYQRAVEM